LDAFARTTPLTLSRSAGVGQLGGSRQGLPGAYALTHHTVELIPTLGALFPPRRARPGSGPHRRCVMFLAERRGRTTRRHRRQWPRTTWRLRPYPEYSRANSYPWSPFPPRRARPGSGPHRRCVMFLAERRGRTTRRHRRQSPRTTWRGSRARVPRS